MQISNFRSSRWVDLLMGLCPALPHTCTHLSTRDLTTVVQICCKNKLKGHLSKITFILQMKALYWLTSQAYHAWASAPLFNLDHTRFPLMGCCMPSTPLTQHSSSSISVQLLLPFLLWRPTFPGNSIRGCLQVSLSAKAYLFHLTHLLRDYLALHYPLPSWLIPYTLGNSLYFVLWKGKCSEFVVKRPRHKSLVA